ncbi:MAG TPA: NADH-quinone oxidoreductase subunit H [Candidatus Omnitrophota bacterium]|nr:NADH-quinone oxidoreductase subunit H [Candidatus Omnitrophota bacterium]HPD84243.1 NADH-quinone oxidoreductase subunit H [Candidatus Omnitrophota bacterium]HRZ03099.1 NADH-quinone oxidoreductase subunit H [Candidatus Omnitrophota bacterium]
MDILITIAQLIVFIVVSPFISGLISKIKNNIRMRKGQSIFQPYYNFFKLFAKGEVVSQTASWIFKVTPFVVIASSLAAASLVPALITSGPSFFLGDFLALIFILALGRFFMALAALDTGSAFGGMGSSREMFISSLVEPAVCLVIFAVSLQFGTTNIASFSHIHMVSISSLAAVAALFFVVIAETSRIPVDNQETHLELTMVHEAMVLEYSGRSLALIELASYIKQMMWFFLIAQIIFPIALPIFGNGGQFFYWFLWYLARILIIAIAMAVVEASVAKMRLFRVADFLGFAVVLAMVATVCAILGV